MNEKNLLIGYVGSSALPSVTPEDALKMTHINVAFGHVKDSRVTVANTRNLDTLSKLRDYNPNLGILLSLGGWSAGGFSEAAATPEGRETFATTAVVAVENTIGGYIYPIENLRGIRRFADAHNLKVHMDGARIFNAQEATSIPVKEWASFADTITFCLSKGLGAPIGSMLCGSHAFIREALTVRKMLGGGMRQTGILAAAGLWALDHHVERLGEDHLHAKMIAKSLEKSGATVDMEGVQTNIIFFTVDNLEADQVLSHLERVGILANTEGKVIRLVTNLDISADDATTISSIIENLDWRS